MEEILNPLKTLADESRLRIIWMLEERYLCVCEIQAALALAQSTVSRHLMLLEESGFVLSRKEGPWKNYFLNPSPPPAVQGLLAVVRLHALSDAAACAQRERAALLRRENLCCGA